VLFREGAGEGGNILEKRDLVNNHLRSVVNVGVGRYSLIYSMQ
jgi:hypothetical protein